MARRDQEGTSAAGAVNPTLEDHHWRKAFERRPYGASKSPYEQYQPAYKFGWEARLLHPDRRWDEVEPELAERWNERREGSTLPWEHAREAAQDAWHRLSHRSESDRSESHPSEPAEQRPVLDLETSESNLDRPTPRPDIGTASGPPGAAANQRREDETLH